LREFNIARQGVGFKKCPGLESTTKYDLGQA